MKGYDCWVMSGSEEGFKSLGLRPDRKIKVYNGDLECSFRKFAIYDGTKRIHKLQNGTEEVKSEELTSDDVSSEKEVED
jgi:putative N6-adenine-specific DNA methylase